MEKKHMILGLAIAAGLAGIAILAGSDKGKSIRKQLKKKGLSKVDDWKHMMERYVDSKA